MCIYNFAKLKSENINISVCIYKIWRRAMRDIGGIFVVLMIGAGIAIIVAGLIETLYSPCPWCDGVPPFIWGALITMIVSSLFLLIFKGQK